MSRTRMPVRALLLAGALAASSMATITVLPGCSSGAREEDRTEQIRSVGATVGDREVGSGRGAEVYLEYCAACHGENGEGIGSIYPPLADADYLQDRDRTVRSILNGLEGPITVNGREFNGVMPPLPPAYDDETAAAVINYVVERFGGDSWHVTAEEVSGIRD